MQLDVNRVFPEHTVSLNNGTGLEILALSDNNNSLALVDGFARMQFLDLLNIDNGFKKYTYRAGCSKPSQLQFVGDSLFSVNEGYLGLITEENEDEWKKTSCTSIKLSVKESRGATIGQSADKVKLIFWDFATFQEMGTFNMEWQGRNLCEMVGSNALVTLQSGTFKEPNELALWDTRSKTRVECKTVKGENNSLAVIETSGGPAMVTYSISKGTIDFRNIFGNFGQVMTSVEVELGEGGFKNYSVSALAKNNFLSTITRDEFLNEGPISPPNRKITTNLTIKTYDLAQSNLQENSAILRTPNITAKFSEIPSWYNLNQPKQNFALGSGKIATVDSSSEKTKVFIYKI